MMHTTQVAEKIGRNVRTLRTYRGESQRDLADVLEVTRPVITHIESGLRCLRVTELLILARHFHVSVEKALLKGLATKPPF